MARARAPKGFSQARADVGEHVSRAELLRALAAPDVRVENTSFSGLELEDVAANGTAFEGVVFRGCTLEGVDLSGCTFTDVLFSGCRLVGCKLERSWLNRCDLCACSAPGLSLAKSRLTGVLLEDCQLSYLDLSDATVERLRAHKACDHKQHADDDEDRKRLAQNDDGRRHGDHRDEVDVDGAGHCPKELYGHAPEDKAQTRGDEAQEHKVAAHGRDEELVDGDVKAVVSRHGNHADDAPEEDAPRHRQSREPQRRDALDEQRIRRPDETCACRKQIALPVELNALFAAPADEPHTRKRKRKPQEEPPVQRFA